MKKISERKISKNKSNLKKNNYVRQADRIRSINMDDYNMVEQEETSEDDLYDQYYDDPGKTSRTASSQKSTVLMALSLVGAIAVLVIVLVFVIKPSRTQGTGLLQETASQGSAALLIPEDESGGFLTESESLTQTVSDTTEPQTTYSPLPDDTQAPVIYGVMPLILYQGHSIAYKQGVYVVDDLDDDPVLEIDNDAVDPSTPGTYFVTYIARDRNGNETKETTTVTIMAGQDVISEDEIYDLADSILDYIITEDENTDALKCLKVYEYLHAIGYVDEVHSQDWMQNAYWMLMRREGDCFCYYSAARLLLTRLGYEVMEVRNNNNYVHFWCMVSTDSGQTWWHFDPTCWSWGEDGILCLVSDNYLSEFTHRHKTSDGRLIHAWDRTTYPATPEEDFWTDEDRAVIYEGGLIEQYPQYDPDDDIWNENDGWDYYPVGVYFEDFYTDEDVYNSDNPEETYEQDEETEQTSESDQYGDLSDSSWYSDDSVNNDYYVEYYYPDDYYSNDYYIENYYPGDYYQDPAAMDISYFNSISE